MATHKKLNWIDSCIECNPTFLHIQTKQKKKQIL